MYASIGAEPHYVQRGFFGLDMAHGIHEFRIPEKLAAFYLVVDSLERLPHNPSRAKMEMPDLAVPHCSRWKANALPGCIKRCIWEFLEVCIVIGRLCQIYAVSLSWLGNSPAVKHNKNHFP